MKRPSARNMEIYRMCRIELLRQTTVAARYRLSDGRISQIVKQVSLYMADHFPGADVDGLFADAQRMRLLDIECHERRVELYRNNQLVFDRSQDHLKDMQCTYEGPAEPNNLVKTVLKRREQPLAMGPLREMRRLNNEIQWGGERPPRSDKNERKRDGEKERRKDGEVPPVEKLPPPECLRDADRAEWPSLMREEQDLAAKRLAIWPDISLANARVPEGAAWSYYPWRTEAEHNAAKLAELVVMGIYTIEEYFQQLEILELSKPYAHPNMLTKDRQGRWQLLYPEQVPLPVMPPERAALPAESSERLYWPNKSKAEHYAIMRAEMVLRGHLSPDQYERLNAWASWYMNEEYPDPLARIGEKFSVGGAAESADKALADKALTSGRGDGREEGAPDIGHGFPSGRGDRGASPDGSSTLTNGPGDAGTSVHGSSTLTTGQGFETEREGVAGTADIAPTSGRGDAGAGVDGSSTLTSGQGFETERDGKEVKRSWIERRLASGRRLAPGVRKRFEAILARQRARDQEPLTTGAPLD